MDESTGKPSRPSRGNGAFFFGAVWGALIGAALAFWRAPRSGEATRDLLREQAEKARRKIEGEGLGESLEAGKAIARRLNRRGEKAE